MKALALCGGLFLGIPSIIMIPGIFGWPVPPFVILACLIYSGMIFVCLPTALGHKPRSENVQYTQRLTTIHEED